jgi:hypothetical protein
MYDINMDKFEDYEDFITSFINKKEANIISIDVSVKGYSLIDVVKKLLTIAQILTGKNENIISHGIEFTNKKIFVYEEYYKLNKSERDSLIVNVMIPNNLNNVIAVKNIKYDNIICGNKQNEINNILLNIFCNMNE